MLAAGLYASGVETSLIRGYQLPAAARPEDWLLAISYSGNTEEALSVFDEAEDRGLTRVAITSGGALADRARAARVPLLSLTGGSPPRAAAGWVYAAAFEVCFVDGERVRPQLGGFYGGWITSDLAGPFKGVPGSQFW